METPKKLTYEQYVKAMEIKEKLLNAELKQNPFFAVKKSDILILVCLN